MNDAQSIKERQKRATAMKGSDQVEYLASCLYDQMINCIKYKSELAPDEPDIEFDLLQIQTFLVPLVDKQVRAKCGLGDMQLMRGCSWDGLFGLVLGRLSEKLLDGGFTTEVSQNVKTAIERGRLLCETFYVNWSEA